MFVTLLFVCQAGRRVPQKASNVAFRKFSIAQPFCKQMKMENNRPLVTKIPIFDDRFWKTFLAAPPISQNWNYFWHLCNKSISQLDWLMLQRFLILKRFSYKYFLDIKIFVTKTFSVFDLEVSQFHEKIDLCNQNVFSVWSRNYLVNFTKKNRSL